MIGSDWPHAEGVADPMAQAERAVAGLRRTGPGQHAWEPTRPGSSACDHRPRGRGGRAGAPARRPTCRSPQARPTSTARGVHHLALLCSDVERTIRFYQGLLGFPLVELFENRDYKGSTHLFFDLGHDNTLAFFDFPGSRARALRRGAGRVPPSRHLGRPGRSGTRRGPAWTRPASPRRSRARSRSTSRIPTACGWSSSPRTSARCTARRCTDGRSRAWPTWPSRWPTSRRPAPGTRRPARR